MLQFEASLLERAGGHDGMHGSLRFGIGELSAATWLPQFFRKAAEYHPNLAIEPTVGQARSMELDVERGTLDCAVIAGHTTRAHIASQLLCNVAFSWMASPNLKLRGVMLTPGTLRQHPIIAPNALSGQSQAFNDWLSMTGASVERVIRCNSLNAIVELTVAGRGISVLPDKHLAPLRRRRLLMRMKSMPEVPPMQYTFIWRRDDTRALLAAVKQMVIKEVDFDLTTPLWR